jgi:hypothetical protein
LFNCRPCRSIRQSNDRAGFSYEGVFIVAHHSTAILTALLLASTAAFCDGNIDNRLDGMQLQSINSGSVTSNVRIDNVQVGNGADNMSVNVGSIGALISVTSKTAVAEDSGQDASSGSSASPAAGYSVSGSISGMRLEGANDGSVTANARFSGSSLKPGATLSSQASGVMVNISSNTQ